MNNFEYIRPATISDAVTAAARPGTAYLASGTNLLDLMKGGIARPSALVDITRLPGLDRVERLADGGLRIGALVRNADLAHDPDFATSYPAVAEALLSGASAQLRNAATVGGNLCSGRAADIFMTSPAPATSASPARVATRVTARADCMPCLVGARPASPPTRQISACRWLRSMPWWRSRGRAGRRELALESLHRLPGEAPERESVLEPGDLIVALRLPGEARAFASHARYLKVRERTSYAFAVVSAAAMLRIEHGTIREARLALGGVAAKPWRTRAAEDGLAGASPTPGAFLGAAQAALADARPSGNNLFKIELAKRILVRTLTLAAAGTPDRIPALPASPFSVATGALHVA